MLRFINEGLRWTITLAVMLMACAPPPFQFPAQTAQATKRTGTSAAEINAALATIAVQTALPSADYQIGPDDLLQVTLYNISEGTPYQLQASPIPSYRVTPRTVSLRVSQLGMITLRVNWSSKSNRFNRCKVGARAQKPIRQVHLQPGRWGYGHRISTAGLRHGFG